MNKYEWIERLSKFMQEHHGLVMSIDRWGHVSASFLVSRGGFIGYVTGGRVHQTVGKEGDEFKEATYTFLKWVLEEESKQ